MEPKYAKQYTKRQKRNLVFSNPSQKRMEEIRTARESIIERERNRVPQPKWATLRQLSQALRPSHVLTGGGIENVAMPNGSVKRIVIPCNIIENDRHDNSRKRREEMKETNQ